jgi:type I restriction enzyme S subunit
MLSPYFWNEVVGGLRGIAYKGLNLSTLRDFKIPLPPLWEQELIVEKVRELFLLCDDLKNKLDVSSDLSKSALDIWVNRNSPLN